MNGAKAVAKLPANLAPGNYLVRHEIIALHLASGFQGAEFYPSCTQIRVSGNGNGRPNNNELVSFPGAYSDNDAGIQLNPYGNGAYNFPGPAIASFVTNPAAPGGNGGGNNGGDNGSGNNTSKTSAVPKPTSSTKAATNTKDNNNNKPTATTGSSTKPKLCKLRKGSSSAGKAKVARATDAPSNYPRHFSRVMKRMVGDNGFEARAVSPPTA